MNKFNIRIRQRMQIERECIVEIEAPNIETAVSLMMPSNTPSWVDPRWKQTENALVSEEVGPA